MLYNIIIKNSIEVNFYRELCDRIIKIHRHAFWNLRVVDSEVLNERKKRANSRTSTKHG